nr:hypothetical protein [Tanacetum cinerariifolium]
EKILLFEALESGDYLDPKQLAFLVDNGDTIIPAQASQEIPTPVAFQTDDVDAFDSNCDDVPSAKAVLMANLSSYDSDILSEVPFQDTNIENDMSSQIKTHVALSVTDDEETLELAEESRLKMLAKYNDPSLKKHKVNIKPVDYVALLDPTLDRSLLPVKDGE